MVEKRYIIRWVVLLICLPYLGSLLALTVEMTNICGIETLKCVAYQRMFFLTAIYLVLGAITFSVASSNFNHWRIFAWLFLSISIARMIYSYRTFPGVTFLEITQVKVVGLKAMIDKGDTITLLLLFLMDFLNPLLLLFACWVMVDSNPKRTTA